MRSCARNWLLPGLLATMSLLTAPHLGAAATRVLEHHVPSAVAAARKLGPMSRTAELRLAIGLPLRNQTELDTLLQAIADPASPNYHAYLTPEQFTPRFGPTEIDYQSVIAFAE